MITALILPAALIMVGGVILFYRHQRKLKLRAHLMREAIRNHDFTFRLPVKGLFFGEQALQEALNDLGQDINKLVAANEVESWQKLTRVLTHEIMNVSTPIQSISQAYLEHSLVRGTPLEKGIQAINEASHNLVTFVDSYRKLTQLQEPIKDLLLLNDFVSGIREFYPSLQWKTLILPDVTVNTDKTLLRQVLVNIIKNAIEAKAKVVEFRWTEGLLHISNDGNPIPAEVRRDIFIPFFTTKPTGTGIGLALSRQIITMQGGSMSLADKAESGYHVTFVLDFGK
ncbi:MAG: HAMP domain-containing sensor histidine kinase [Bacteroidales bacterium]|nr:HAMP domain-containing sensor histidine kinase [Bacteroidales bacterium]